MSWQLGTTLLGIGLAIFSMVAPMLGMALPRWLLVMLLGVSILLGFTWPISWAATFIPNEKIRLGMLIGIGSILGGTIFGLIGWTITAESGESIRALREKSLALAAEFRSLQQRMDRDYQLIHDRHMKRFLKATTDEERSQIFLEETSESSASSNHFNEEFRLLRPKAIILRDALLKQLPSMAKDEDDKFADHTLRNWFMAGVRPAANVGDYLEKLALSLPEK